VRRGPRLGGHRGPHGWINAAEYTPACGAGKGTTAKPKPSDRHCHQEEVTRCVTLLQPSPSFIERKNTPRGTCKDVTNGVDYYSVHIECRKNQHFVPSQVAPLSVDRNIPPP
jgi:hypothetical protein